MCSRSLMLIFFGFFIFASLVTVLNRLEDLLRAMVFLILGGIFDLMGDF